MYKGDAFLDLGTLPELAKKYHVKQESLAFKATKVYRKRVKDGTVLIRIEDDDE